MLKRTFKGVMSVGNLVTAIVVAIVLGATIGVAADFTIGNQNVGNITGATSTMLGLVPLFIVIAVVISYAAFRK